MAKFINADIDNIYFTSGGSASNTLAIRGYTQKNTCTVLYSPTSHKSVLKCVSSLKYPFTLKVTHCGMIDLNDLESWFDEEESHFVIVEYANSEIGTIQPVKEIIDLVHSYNGIVYLDCTGSISQIPLDVKELDVDMCGFSAHKIGGLKGCGVFYKKPEIEIEPLIYGSQEQGFFGGTENILGIASLGTAVELMDYSSISSENRDYVYKWIMQNISNCYVVGDFVHRLPHNLYMCFKGIDGESLMTLLDMNDIQVSTGSACNSGDLTPSTTLSAIDMDKEDINSCIRITFNGEETKEELDYFCNTLKKCVEQLRVFSR